MKPEKKKIAADKTNLERAMTYVKAQVPPETYLSVMQAAMDLRKNGLKYETLNDSDKEKADKGSRHIKVSVAMGAFVAACFLTECIPLPAVMIPVTWFTNIRFRPKIVSPAPSMAHLKSKIDKMGGWNRKQIRALIIFLVMVFGWFTEKAFHQLGIYPVRLGIGTIAVGGAIVSSLAYCLIIGTPPNAIVYASGYLEPKDYLLAGLPLFFVANVVLLLLTGAYWTIRGFGTMSGF